MPAFYHVDAILAIADARLDASCRALIELLAIPSVSAQPGHKTDCQRGAERVCATPNGPDFEAA